MEPGRPDQSEREWENVESNVRRSLLENDLFLACLEGDTERIRKILEEDSSVVNYAEKSQLVTPLHAAVYKNRNEVVRMLLKELNLNIISHDVRGRTPLDEAYGHVIAGQKVKESCLFSLATKLEEKAQCKIDELKTRSERKCLWDRDKVRRILSFLFPEITDMELEQAEGAYVCSFPCDHGEEATRVRLIHINGTSYFCLDRAYEQLEQCGPRIRVVLRHRCKCQQECSYLWAIILMKAAAEWFSVQKPDNDSDGNGIGKSVKAFVDKLLGDADATLLSGRLLVEAIEDEVRRTVTKVEMCLRNFKHLKNSNNSDIHVAAVAFLRFLEAFALRDCYVQGTTGSQRVYIARRKKDYFERLFSSELIEATRRIRKIFCDRHTGSGSGSWPRFLSAENMFKSIERLKDSFQLDDELHRLVECMNESLQDKSFTVDRRIIENALYVLEVCDAANCREQMKDEEAEQLFYSNASAYIKCQDRDERERLKNTLEYDLIVNMRGMVDSEGLSIEPRPLVLRNQRTHLTSLSSLATEDVASGIFDCYRYHFSKIVHDILMNPKIGEGELESKIISSLETFNKKFTDVNVWFSRINFSLYSGCVPKDHTVEPGDEDSREIVEKDIEPYVQFMVPLLINGRDRVRDAYENLNGDEKRDLLEHFKKGNTHSTEEELVKRFGFTRDEAAEFLEQMSKQFASISFLEQQVINAYKILNTIKEYTKKCGVTWQDVATLYEAYVQENDVSSCFNYAISLQNLEPEHKKGVEERLKGMPKPKLRVTLDLESSIADVFLKDVVTDLLSLLTGQYKPATLLLTDTNTMFNDQRFVDYLIDRSVQEKPTSCAQTDGFFYKTSMEEPRVTTVVIKNRNKVLSMIKRVCKLKSASRFAALLVAKLPPPTKTERVGKETIDSLTENVLSEDYLLPVLLPLSQSSYREQVYKIISKYMKDDKLKKSLSKAVLEILIDAPNHHDFLRESAVPDALSLILDWIEMRKLVKAKSLMEVVEAVPLKDPEMVSYLKLCKAHLLVQSDSFEDQPKERLTVLNDALSELSYDAMPYTNARHKMMALYLKMYIDGKLGPLIHLDKDKLLSSYQDLLKDVNTLWHDLWNFISSNEGEPPSFDIYIKKCLSSQRYKNLLKEDHFCRRFLNVYNLKYEIGFTNFLAARVATSNRTREKYLLGAVDDLKELFCHSVSRRKYGTLRTFRLLAGCYYYIGNLDNSNSTWQLYYFAKATEWQLFLIERRELTLGASHPDDEKALGHLRRYLYCLRRALNNKDREHCLDRSSRRTFTDWRSKKER